MSQPTNRDNVIDSRDIIERIAELREEIGENTAPDDFVAEREELATLETLATEAADYASDWEYGETLVRDSYWRDYARELVEECGYFHTDRSPHSSHGETYAPDFNTWPYRCIDWKQVAEELKADYTTVSFDGVDYWIRSV